MALRILTALTYYRPHWTGLTACAAALADALAARGHVVTVATTRHASDLAARERVDGVDVVRARPVARISRGMIAPGLLAAVVRRLPSHDVLLLHVPMADAGPLAAAARAAGRPVVLLHHGDLVLPRGLGNRLVGLGVRQSMLVAGHLATALVTYSDDYAGHSRFLTPFSARTHAIAPPIAMPLPDDPGGRRWRAARDLGNRRIVGVAGRWVEEKGFDVLLRAWPRLRRQVPEAHLVFAGERAVVYERFYDRCAPLLDAVRPHVTECGLLRDPHSLANFYAGCDVFALPSRSECLARTQVEAMLCGTPVVASNIPGARTAVRRTGMGVLVPPEDPDALADALARVLRDPDHWRRPRAEVAAAYDTEAAADAWERVLTAAVSRRETIKPWTRDGHAWDRGRHAEVSARTVSARPAVPTAATRLAGTGLSAADRRRLRELQAHELDIAFRRRTVTLLDFLELREGARVLDCGCGPGVHLALVDALRGGRLRMVGTDGDAARLRDARRRVPRAPIVRADLRHLPFAPGSFDAILLAEVLEHVTDAHALLERLHALLRPGGVLAVSVPHAHYPRLWDPINALWTALGGQPFRGGPLVGLWTHHVRLYTPDQLTASVREAGFAVEHVEAATHAGLPFHHFLVYGIGKPLVEGGWLPRRMHAVLDRGARKRTRLPWWHPLSLAIRLVDRIDRRNDRPAPHARRFVNVLLKARRLDADASGSAVRAAADVVSGA